MDALSAASHPRQHARTAMGHPRDAPLADPLHHRLHHGRAELCRHRAAGTGQRHDADAHAADDLGNLHGHGHGAARLPGALRRRRDDAARPADRHQLLHAGHRRDGRAAGLQGRQPDPVPAPVLVLRPSRGLHRGATGLRHRLRPDQHPCAQEHLRLPDDGLGAGGDRRAQLPRLGASHVCQRCTRPLGSSSPRRR